MLLHKASLSYLILSNVPHLKPVLLKMLSNAQQRD